MNRYLRHIQLQGFGPDAQQRLESATVLIVGAGALGTVCGMYLASSGIGNIRVVDFDTIDITNLQRQLSFTEGDVGKLKADTLAAKMRAINSTITVESYCQHVDEELFAGADLAIEASDNPATKYFLSDTAERLAIPYVFGGIAQWRGQVMCWQPGHHGYRHIYPEEADTYLPAAVGGVLGPLPGIIGSIMAIEAIKILSGAGTPMLDTLLALDARTMRFASIAF